MSNYIMDLRKLVGHRPLLQVGASVIVEDAEGQILLQLRSDNLCWGYAGGSVELDEVVEDAAKRELLEETGYVSDEWQYLGATVESSAKLTNYMHIYFANHCRKVSGQHLDATEELDVLVVPLKQAVDMVMNNEICCNSSAHGILKVGRLLGV